MEDLKAAARTPGGEETCTECGMDVLNGRMIDEPDDCDSPRCPYVTPATPGAETDARVAEIEKRHAFVESDSVQQLAQTCNPTGWAARAHADRATLLAILRAQSPHGRTDDK